MGRFYCDYCHCYLTHDSASVRKAHNLGRGHLTNVKEYYQKLGFDKTQSVIDSLTQDWKASAIVEPTNPFAPAGLPSAFGGRPGFPPPMGGMGFGGASMMAGGFGGPPVPGMPLPPPPGMPLPGGSNAQAPPGMMMPGQFAPPSGGIPPPMPQTGGRVGQ